MRPRLAAIYFLAQAIGIAAWWALLAIAPAVRPLFALRNAPLAALGAFAPGDLVLIGVGSVVVAWQAYRGRGAALAWVVSGAMAYAAVYTLAAAVLRLAPALGAVLMVPAAGASLGAAAVLSRSTNAHDVPPRPRR